MVRRVGAAYGERLNVVDLHQMPRSAAAPALWIAVGTAATVPQPDMPPHRRWDRTRDRGTEAPATLAVAFDITKSLRFCAEVVPPRQPAAPRRRCRGGRLPSCPSWPPCRVVLRHRVGHQPLQQLPVVHSRVDVREPVAELVQSAAAFAIDYCLELPPLLSQRPQPVSRPHQLRIELRDQLPHLPCRLAPSPSAQLALRRSAQRLCHRPGCLRLPRPTAAHQPRPRHLPLAYRRLRAHRPCHHAAVPAPIAAGAVRRGRTHSAGSPPPSA